MNILVGHASVDERGKIQGGLEGDQTEKEVCTKSYYLHSKGWYLLRPISVEHANAISEAMLRACNNDNIGYDQYNRLGVIKYGTSTKIKTECDCSSLVRQCVIEGTGVDAGNFITSNEKDKLYSTGLFEKPISVTKATVVYNGDILVTKTKGHTVIVVSGNPRIKKDDEEMCYVAKTTSDLNLRSTPNSTYRTNVITVIPKNSYVCVTDVSTGVWVMVQTVVNNKSYVGYVSSKYLTKVNTSNNEQRKVTTWGLNARSGQKTTCSKVFTMKKDDVFTIIDKDKWGLILFNNQLAYANISNAYSKKITKEDM